MNINHLTENSEFDTTRCLFVRGKEFKFHSLNALAEQGYKTLHQLPWTYRVLLESLLRHRGEPGYADPLIQQLADWEPGKPGFSLPFLPARILLQDFTGIPVLNDMTSIRSALHRQGIDAHNLNFKLPCDLVIDHSIQVDEFGCEQALKVNEELEFTRNSERFQFLRWCQKAYPGLRVIPPGKGIIHQINLEFLANVVSVSRAENGDMWAFPDSVLGTDSHTTMVNGLGVLGWGVGGIEAVSALLGISSEINLPEVIGIKLINSMPKHVTPADLTLSINSFLRQADVVGKVIEVFGPALFELGAEERAAIANMTPESGATATYFPVDENTLRYLKLTGRSDFQLSLVKDYCCEQGLFYLPTDEPPAYETLYEFDLSRVQRVVAGPSRPHAIKELGVVSAEIKKSINARTINDEKIQSPNKVVVDNTLPAAAVVLAAITSCTNTSSAVNMLAAGLLAKRAVERGLTVPAWVKTVHAPGSRVVSDYLRKAGLLSSLETLGFHLAGYGCTVCIGNSGPLRQEVIKALHDQAVLPCAVLSGNRNFDGRIHPAVQASFLASPPLVVAYALAGRMDIDFTAQPVGVDQHGNAVMLDELWPERNEIENAATVITPQMYRDAYAQVQEGSNKWNELRSPDGYIFPWSDTSVYLREPPFLYKHDLQDLTTDITGARAIAFFGDGISTDHISPAGSIEKDSPAWNYLRSLGVAEQEMNTFGAYRANHAVMLRGVFSNPRLENKLAEGKRGGLTRLLPSGKLMDIFTAAEMYKHAGVPLIVIAGKGFGVGSSRDWAAKGLALLGVHAIIAQSFERIHRANLVMMGVLPLQFNPGENAENFGLCGSEVYTIKGVEDVLRGGSHLTVKATRADGTDTHFDVLCRIDTALEMEYWKNGGILPFVLKQFNT